MPDYCCVIGCTNGRKSIKSNQNSTKTLSFYRIPAIIYHTSKEEEILSSERRNGWIANIHRADLDMNNLKQYRVCSCHFHSGNFEETSLYS